MIHYFYIRIWILINISAVTTKRMQEGTNLGMLKAMQFGREIFTSGPAACITVDFKKFVSDLFHASSALVESERIKRKIGLSEQPRNIIVALEHFHMQCRSTMQCISLTLHYKYPTKGLWDQC